MKTEDSMKIDGMKEQDLEEVIALGNVCEGFQTGTNADQFYCKETLARWINDPNGVTLVARDEGKLAGFILGSYLTGPRGSYIHSIEVKEQYRRKGVGAKLVQKALEEFRQKGGVHVFCVVNDLNREALDFFKDQKFEVGKSFRYVEMML